MLNVGNRAADEIGMDVLEILLQFFEGLALGLVVWIFFQITRSHVINLPINISNDIHVFRILNKRVIFNLFFILFLYIILRVPLPCTQREGLTNCNPFVYFIKNKGGLYAYPDF